MLARLLQKRAGQADQAWPLAFDRPLVIGRSRDADIALIDDRFVSRQHAKVWHADGRWWIADLASRHGTLVGGRAIAAEPVALTNGAEVLVGNTLLVLTTSDRPTLECGPLHLEIDATPAVNFALVHCGFPIVEHITARATTPTPAQSTLSLHLPPYAQVRELTLPALPADGVASFKRPPVVLNYAALQAQTERARCSIQVRVDGQLAHGDSLECWVLAHNEWSATEAHRISLAAFVLPNHPLIGQLASDLDPSGANPSDLLAALHQQLSGQWRITYRLEPPHWSSTSQKIRLPHQVLVDPVERIGAGTCLDLALLYAACLEHVGLQPLLAIIDMGEWWHALVGAWREPGTYLGLEPIVVVRQRLLGEADWIDPTACTTTPELRQDAPGARAQAARILEAQPLQFGLDVRAARVDNITPLPFAGDPYPSPAVLPLLESAGGAALLLGLLGIEGGLTRQLIARRVGSLETARQRIGTIAAQRSSGVSVRRARDLARSLARDEGSPMILESHVLAALLQTPSGSLDAALNALGVRRNDLDASDRGTQYSVFSEWRGAASRP